DWPASIRAHVWSPGVCLLSCCVVAPGRRVLPSARVMQAPFAKASGVLRVQASHSLKRLNGKAIMFNLSIDARELIKVGEVYDQIGKQTPLALSRALNWTGNKARTAAGRKLAEQTGLRYGKVRAEIRTYPAKPSDLEYSIGVSGRAIPLAEFNARQTRAGVSAAPWATRRVFPHTFIVR